MSTPDTADATVFYSGGKMRAVGWTATVLAGIFIILATGYSILHSANGENLHLLQAEAFLNGRASIQQQLNDTAVFDGKVFVPFPPVPAIILIPVVAVFGTARFLPPLLGVILTVFSILLLLRILKILNIGKSMRSWVALAFFLGTGYWSCILMSSGAGECYFSHIVAVFFVLLAVREILVGGRGLLAGAFLGAAFLSRQLSIAIVFFLVPLLWNRRKTPDSRRNQVIKLAFSILISVLIYMLWNYLRFGNPMETGYSLIHLEGFLAERVNAHSHFNIHYLPFNLYHMFIKGLDFAWREPSLLLPMKPDAFGTSLTVASPFVLFAFKAVWKKNVTIGGWAAILVMLIPAMLYYNNGWIQVNCQRFSLDFMPVLILLAARGIGNRKLFKIAVVWAISLNIISFGTLYVSQLLY